MKSQRIEYIDFGKGFAILAIVFFHYSQPYASGIWGQAVMLGGTGVHLFFVLSGFGLGIAGQIPGVMAFYRKRFKKILIPYYVIVIFIFLVNCVWPIYPTSGLYALGGHIFLYKMFDERIIGSFGYHFWFISTIVQFYLVYPLLSHAVNSAANSGDTILNLNSGDTIPNSGDTILNSIELSIVSPEFKRAGGLLFFGLCFFASGCYWVLITALGLAELRVVNSFFLQYLWEFSLGMVMADVYKKKGAGLWQLPPGLLFSASILCLCLMGLLAVKGGSTGRTFNDIFASAGFLSLSAFAFTMLTGRLDFLRKSIVFIGSISYELYLLHLFVHHLFLRLAGQIFGLQASIYLSFLAILPVAIFFSWLFATAGRLKPIT